jgi:hypothetical protein
MADLLSIQNIGNIGRMIRRSRVAGQFAVFTAGRVPNGWMACQGQTLDVAKYPALFAAIGNAHGGDGVTTFRLPDFRGVTPIVSDSSAGTAVAVLVGIDGPYEVIEQPPVSNDLVLYLRGMIYGAGATVEFHGGTLTTPHAVSDSNGVCEIDANVGDFFMGSAFGAVTWKVKNAKPGKTLHLQITNGASGAQAFWPGIKWANGTQPTFTQYVDGLVFTYNGQFWVGSMAYSGAR